MVSLRTVQWLALACLAGACVDAAPQGQYWEPVVTPAITAFNPFWRPRPPKETVPPPPPTETPPTEAPIPEPTPEPIPAPEPVTEAPPPSEEIPETEETETPAPTPNTTEPTAADETKPTPTKVAPTPAPTKYVAPPIPVTGTQSLAKVENPVCGDDVVKTIYDIYTKNRALFDVCAEKSKYQIFPFSGKLPTPTQIRAMATTDACTVLFTACVVSKLPECDNSGLNLKAVTETLLKVTLDVQNGRPSPDTMRFHEMHYWRRDSNLAKAAGLPYGNDSALYAEFTHDVPAALEKYSVQVQPDLTIVYNGTDVSRVTDNTFFFNKTSGSMADVVGEVHPNDGAVDDGSDDGEVTDAQVETLSGAPSSMTVGLALSSTLAVFAGLLLLE